jgi:hypothetical protein
MVSIGQNGSGKTIGLAWVLSRQRFDRRPWVVVDFKGEEFWDLVGSPPIRPLRLGDMPGRRGLYLMHVNPGQEAELEAWLWRIWKRGDVGLVIDEVALVPARGALKALLRQGRSLRTPILSATQRPVDVDREVFSESRFKMIFHLEDVRDRKVVREFCARYPLDATLPDYWSFWKQPQDRELLILRPVPPPETIAADLRRVVPFGYLLTA